MSETTLKGSVSIRLGILPALRVLFGSEISVHLTSSMPPDSDSGSLVVVRVGDEVIHTETSWWVPTDAGGEESDDG